MLEELERTNLFVVPLDEQQQWYRYHDLFRETLRARLYASQPELVPLLHAGQPAFMRRQASCGRPLYTRWLRLTTPLPPP
jgi:ATP/maltotriose-dependent transcriptional regulator MalT